MKHALLAEDDPVNRAFLCEALALLGWQVVAFDNGEQAAEAAVAQCFDVLLLDLNLPGANGIDTLRHIRNLDSHASADAPALALTADHRPEQHQRLRQQGFDAVATKPLSVEQLAQTLARLGFSAGDVPASTENIATVRPVSGATLPVWDDAHALAGVAGNPATLAALRKLMLDDLPAQRDRILAAPQSRQAQDELHRLRAACGFCGAARLAQAVIELERAEANSEAQSALTHFVHAVEQTLACKPHPDSPHGLPE